MKNEQHPVSNIAMSVMLYNKLKNLYITNLEEICKFSKLDLQYRGFGHITLRELERILTNHDLKLND